MTNAPIKFRSAIIGAGHIAPFHIAGIRSCPNVELVALCDLDTDRARQLAQEHAIPEVVDAVDKLRSLGVDVIHVATPPASHFGLTMQALDLGCHVFVEKPLTTSVEHCEQIALRAAQQKRHISVNHSNLFDPFVAKALRHVQAGYIGRVLSACYVRSSTYPDYLGGPLPPHYRDGGFPFRDIGVHALYLIRAVLGEIEDVDATFVHRGDDPNLMFDEWAGIVRCNGGDGLFQLSWNTRPLQNLFLIQGTHGVIRCEPFSMYVTARRSGRLPRFVERIQNSMRESAQIATQAPWNVARFAAGKLKQYHGVQEAIRRFYQELPDGVPAGLTVLDAIPAVRWTEKIARQADEEKRRRLARIPPTQQADILVTGANGFIGRHLLERLLESPERVRILVRSEPAPDLLNHPQVETVIGDLGDPEVVANAVAGVRLIYHLGAAMRGSRADFERGTEVGTRNIVDAALKNGNTRMVYVSSLSVLHASRVRPTDVITEDWPLEPTPERRGNYTLYKLRAEQIVSTAVCNQGLQAIIIRPGQVFSTSAELLTPAVARQMGSRLVVLGDGTVPLPLIFVEDLIDALVAAAEKGPFDGTILQIVDDSVSFDQNELIDRMQWNKPKGPIHVPRPIVYSLALGVQIAMGLLRRRAPLSIYRVRSALSKLRFDCSRARQVLEWKPRAGVEKALRHCSTQDEDVPKPNDNPTVCRKLEAANIG